MGLDTSYYPVGEDLLSDFKASDEKLLYDFIQPFVVSIGDLTEKKNSKYTIHEYGQGTRTWNPMLVLLNKISNSSIFNSLLLKSHKIDDEAHFIDNKSVIEIWKHLKKISVQNIEDNASRPEIQREISVAEGYKMDGIRNPEAIVLEFFELYKAIFHAFRSEQGLVIHQG